MDSVELELGAVRNLPKLFESEVSRKDIINFLKDHEASDSSALVTITKTNIYFTE